MIFLYSPTLDPVARGVLITVAGQCLVAGVIWALNRGVVNIREWFVSISVLRAEVHRLRTEVMILKSEGVKAARITIPPPLPTMQVEASDEDWDDSEDQTEVPT
jgi:hypothetical protein